MKNKNLLIVISGPSGVGKGSVIKELLSYLETIELAISATTRKKREGEEEGKDYYFFSDDIFDKAIKNDEFIEWCIVHGNRYGTLRKEIRRINNKNKLGLVEIDTKGANKIKTSFPDALQIFISPPTIAVLEERLKRRKTESKEDITKRISNAKEEIKKIKHYDYVIINDSIFDSSKEIEEIIRKRFNL
ncbi:guanylate kinase [bacterium]|nr:guanylate kinase [bacterium]|tara:strand:- start:607 stop:1173 length:567 start_codon:yes stop_codon:yes gene_type:complete